ncbi:MAG TPA: (d)CMP kinase [Symbiobacteriaceae bacterium]|nr:(d)CMP kinase [Symbiobacteriaceae bacterium]
MVAEDRTPRLTIALDGPAGAGKSTVAKIVANRLGYLYVDTGAMYRALALKALRLGIGPTDEESLTAMAGSTAVRLERGEAGNRVFLDGEEVTDLIRSPEVTAVVSKVSCAMGLRHFMVEAQRQMGAEGGVVMDGRDIGSYVLPNADRKFFVTASLAERAARRHKEWLGKGHAVDLQQLQAEIQARDEQDMNKGPGSLVQTPDAIVIDTSGRAIEDVVAEILAYCRS